MSGPSYHGPNAGHHDAPDQGHNQSYQPPQQQGYNDQQQYGHPAYGSPPPSHHDYDPKDGYPRPSGFQPPPSTEPSYNPNYFPPPPQSDYDDNLGRTQSRGDQHNYDYVQAQRGEQRDGYGDRDYPDYHNPNQSQSDFHRGSYDRGQPQGDYQYTRNDYNDRPYAPSEPQRHDGNQMAPYDPDKAEAENRRGWDEYYQRYLSH